MKVISCGSQVRSKLPGIEGMITAVSIRFKKVQYEISYFSEKEYKVIWMDENEFDIIVTSKKTTIGFKPTVKL